MLKWLPPTAWALLASMIGGCGDDEDGGGSCQPTGASCGEETTCPSGAVCYFATSPEDARCAPTCDETSDCPTGLTCDTEFGVCLSCGELDGECTTGSTQCDGDVAQTCVDGRWQSGTACALGCDDGACRSADGSWTGMTDQDEPFRFDVANDVVHNLSFTVTRAGACDTEYVGSLVQNSGGPMTDGEFSVEAVEGGQWSATVTGELSDDEASGTFEGRGQGTALCDGSISLDIFTFSGSWTAERE